MGDCSKLPFELLCEIAMRLETIEDLVYFSVVCRLWNHVVIMVKPKFKVKTSPWLLLAESTEDNSYGLRKVFNPSSNKSYQMKLPETAQCRCWGSAYGWLLIFNQELDLFLFNPLTKARMSLPPVSCMPYQWGCFLNEPSKFLEEMRHLFIRKAFILKVGAYQDDVIVFVSYYFGWKRLAFARPGDQSWTAIDHLGHTAGDLRELSNRLGNCVAEVIRRGSQILILYEDASLGYLEIADLSDPQQLIVRDYLPIPPMVLSDPRNLGINVKEYLPALPGILCGFNRQLFGAYLVHSCGDVFIILRYKCYVEGHDGKDSYATKGFKVYKLDFDNKKWSLVHNLGDVVLFVGNCSSLSIPGVGVLKSKTKCICYTDDEDDLGEEEYTAKGNDMGVFDLENRELKDLYDGCDIYSTLQTPFWFMPQW